MKQMKRIISILLVLTMLVPNSPFSAFVMTAGATSEEVFESGDYQYGSLSDGTISICGYTGTSEEAIFLLEIPSSIDGVVVSQVGDHAFANNTEVDVIAVPESIKYIEDHAFAECTDLKAVAFLGELPEFGTSIVDGCDSLEYLFVLRVDDSDAMETVLTDAGLLNVSVQEYGNFDELNSAFEKHIEELEVAAQNDDISEEPTFSKFDLFWCQL